MQPKIEDTPIEDIINKDRSKGAQKRLERLKHKQKREAQREYDR